MIFLIFRLDILNLNKQLSLLSPVKIISDNENKLSMLNNNLNVVYNNIINKNDINVNHYIDKLILLNPLNLMKKGYSITYKDNKVITSVDLLDINDEITVKFQNGNINAKVTRKN